MREAEILALLNHPNLMRLHYFTRTPESLLLYLEDAGSITLAQYVANNRQRCPKTGVARSLYTSLRTEWECQVRTLAIDIGSALRYCHSNCVHHNRLRVDKIMLTQNGFAKLTGFGNNELVTTFTGQSFDTFSYGTVLCFMLCGSVPWRAADNWIRYKGAMITALSKPTRMSSGILHPKNLQAFVLTCVRSLQSCYRHFGR